MSSSIPRFKWVSMLMGASFLAAFSLGGCYKPEPCRNEISSTATSPNGRLKAVVFKRICPYEQTVSSGISVLGVTEELSNQSGNLFAYPDYTPTRVAWIRDDRIAVYTYGNLSKATKIQKIGDVTVEYNEVMETDLVRPAPEQREGH